MVERLLDAADEPIRRRPRSSAARRRAVSTAYYAVFHTLAKLCAKELLPDPDPESEEFLRIYRAIEHGASKQAFNVADSPLRTAPPLKRIGDWFALLQEQRERADYLPPLPSPFSEARAEELVAEGRKACDAIEALSPEDRRVLAVRLLFKARRS